MHVPPLPRLTLSRLASVARPSSAAPPNDSEAAVAMAETLQWWGGKWCWLADVFILKAQAAWWEPWWTATRLDNVGG